MSAEKIKNVASILGATSENDGAWWQTLTLNDMKFYASLVGDKIKFCGNWPEVSCNNNRHTFRHKDHFEIFVSANRDAKSIARDVQNRFLKTYAAQFREMLAASFEFLNEQQRKRSELLEIMSVFSEFDTFEGHGKESFYVQGKPDFKISQKYSGFEFTISDLSFEDSRQLAQVLRIIKLKNKESEAL